MRVYVESNYLVELALEQEQSEACERLLALAEQSRVELVMPVYAVMESLNAVNRRLSGFADLDQKVTGSLEQVGRNATLKAEADGLKGLMLKARKMALGSYENTKSRVLRSGRVLPLDWLAMTKADKMRHDLGLELPDAVMLACVLIDLDASPPTEAAVFANRNTKDFDDPAVRVLLRDRDCTLISSFPAVVAKIESAQA